MYMIGIDTGGTFTDMFAVSDDRRRHDFKAFTTPDFTDGVLEGLAGLAAGFELSAEQLLAQTELFFFSTTMTTNMVVEGEGAELGVLTTVGQRDVLHLMGGARGKTAGLHEADIKHSAMLDKPEPLAPKRRIREVRERIDYAGKVVLALNEQDVVSAVDALVQDGIEALAVCLLWSFRNPVHELRVAELVKERHPQLAVSLSSEVAPRIGEYPRFATTALNAMCAPRFRRYYARLVQALQERGLKASPLVMQATGGVATPAEAEAKPVLTIGSGPVGGVVGCQVLSRAHGFKSVITADMGGTSFDVGLVRDGAPLRVSEMTAGRHVFYAPVVDVVSIGKGGGSIARVQGGRLMVGPESARATPGPVCYARGGTRPTVTDADLVLGFLNPDYFLGGRVALDRDGAERAIEEQIAGPLGMSALEAASGIHEIASAHMSDLIRKKTVEVGYDPRDFALYAFGGAGPVHAHSYARGLGLSEIVVPLGDVASVYSAYGVLASDVVHTYERHHPAREPFDYRELDGVFEELEAGARAQLRDEGFADGEIELARHLDLKYSGQLYEVDIGLDGSLAGGEGERLAERFSQKYDELYGAGAGYRAAGVEVTNCRLYATGKTKSVPAVANGSSANGSGAGALAVNGSGATVTAERFGERQVFWPHDRRLIETAIYRPAAGQAIAVEGPAIVELADTSVPVPAGSAATSLQDGSIIIHFREHDQ
jgi:N-methylhydantoinase A